MNGGAQTIQFHTKPVIIGGYSIVGPKEGEGPLRSYFDYVAKSDLFEQKSYEKAECKMHLLTIERAIDRVGLDEGDMCALLSGDLLNQIISSSFSARELDIPFLGLYNACSTFGEGLCLAAVFISGGFMKRVAVSTSSHFSTAERQYRYPLELGTQQPPTAQWTVTGCGCSVLADQGKGPCITCATIGKVIDYGITDANNMGAAMAPAAAYTIAKHLEETGRSADYYDQIITGDLGIFGSEMLVELLRSEGIEISHRHVDCGKLIFSEKQKVHMGGSGAGCSSSVFNSLILHEFSRGSLHRILFVPTGALLSKDSSLQGESVPAIAHAVAIEEQV